ncbi:universal stress protein UspA [Cytophagales bacterium WSM2-2]|nr:universal stress protein UspA [Cytophagales bacterium WSM2-2]
MPALDAYRQALDICAQSNGEIHLLHVIEPPLMSDTMMMPALNFDAELIKELKEKAENQFKKLVTNSSQGAKKIFYDTRFGAVSTSILECIEKNNIDLVVMGSTGASGLKEYLLGSNAERVVRHSPVPVLVVKKYNNQPIKNIVFPNNLDMDYQEDLILKVKGLQNFFKAKLHIVYINTPASFIVDSITREKLEDFAERFMFENYTINVFNHVSLETGMLEFCKMINGNLIALGTHGRKGINHLMNGSITEDLVNHTKTLVWTYTLKNEAVAS